MTASTETRELPGRSLTGAPDFFLVGHPKSGTSALYEMLRSHPQIFMPGLKEPWFFATDLRARFQPLRAGVRPPETLAEYLALFAPAAPGQLTGEASSSYLLSREAAPRIARARSDARIVAILREPASFLCSLHQQLLFTHVESEKRFAKALSLESARREGRKVPRRSHRPQMLMYSEHVHYVEQLRRYHAEFAREQVLVLIYEDFRADNEGTVRRILRFLGLDDTVPVETVEANPTVRVRSPRLYGLAHRLDLGHGSAARAARTAVGTLGRSAPRARTLAGLPRRVMLGEPRAPDGELMLELRRRFRAEVQALGDYLDRDLLTLWGYDSLG